MISNLNPWWISPQSTILITMSVCHRPIFSDLSSLWNSPHLPSNYLVCLYSIVPDQSLSKKRWGTNATNAFFRYISILPSTRPTLIFVISYMNDSHKTGRFVRTLYARGGGLLCADIRIEKNSSKLNMNLFGYLNDASMQNLLSYGTLFRMALHPPL